MPARILYYCGDMQIIDGFDDNGWMFSKVLAVAVCGYVQWLLACLKIAPFTGMTCVIITVICCLGSILYGIKCKNRITDSLPWEQTTLVYREEILFFWYFFSGHIWLAFTRRLMERKNIWILVLCSP